MKARPYRNEGKGRFVECNPDEATHVWICRPGPAGHFLCPVRGKGKNQRPSWNWNGDTEKPTFTPSLLTTDHNYRCHSFITDGKVRFLSDCSHEFAGQTVDLLDVDEL